MRTKNQQGIAQILLILIILVVLGAVGFAGYTVMGKNKDTSSKSAVEQLADKATQQAAKAECEKINDKDICKFYTSWKAISKYRMTSTDSSGSKTIFEIDGNKSRMSSTGETAYEIITIDKTTYTKAGSVWYKQTIKTPEQTSGSSKIEFDEPTEDTTESKTTYKNLGKEACGNLTCFKYQVIDSANPNDKEFIWFDDKDYQIRKSRSETADGFNEQVFEYGNVSVSEPSPVKELGPNEYIMPGQSEPMTMPSASDFQQ